MENNIDDHGELLQHPNYLLSTYQLEIYRQVGLYMQKNNLKKKDFAKLLGVSNSYVSQVLNGEFNFTLKKLIELGLAIEKVPFIEFINKGEYWRRESGTINLLAIRTTSVRIVATTETIEIDFTAKELIEYKRSKLPKSIVKTEDI